MTDCFHVSINGITTRHLFRLRDSASGFFGRKVTGAVITVSTDFSDTTKEALVAAARARELETPKEKGGDKNILVTDPRCTVLGVMLPLSYLGVGCTPFLRLLIIMDFGRLKLGEVLVDHFSKEFIKKHKVDSGNERSRAKLRLGAEGAKRTLSLGTSATISIESLPDGYDFHFTVNRLQHELTAKKVVDQIVSPAENVAMKGVLDPLDIGEMILSGGTFHTSKIASCIAALFPDLVPVNAPATPTTALNLPELSARGAAIQASLIDGFNKQDIEQSTHPAVSLAPRLPHPSGVIIGEDNSFQTILAAQTAAPAWRIAQFDVQSDGDVIVRIREGIREIVVEQVRKVIAEAAIKGTAESGKVEVTINVGSDLDLNVAARVVGMQIGVRGEVQPEAISAQ
ncbi:hypothetical protein HOY80DRAFT_1058937 [Tuber brumale]|nr:hypothetical protein HOY80DRAFT_1058937 [Tuber brumale]